jgi:hypothetical protein
MLLIGTSLMLKSFAKLQAVDPGFNPDRMLCVRFSLPKQRYKTPVQIASFYRDRSNICAAYPAYRAPESPPCHP